MHKRSNPMLICVGLCLVMKDNSKRIACVIVGLISYLCQLIRKEIASKHLSLEWVKGNVENVRWKSSKIWSKFTKIVCLMRNGSINNSGYTVLFLIV